jgi:hypothetical protein
MFSRIALTLTFCAAVLQADTLHLRNGSIIQGSLVSASEGVIRFSVGQRVNTFNIGDVSSLQFESRSGQAANQPAPSRNVSSRANNPPFSQRSATEAQADAQPLPAADNSIPAGTQVVVRMIDSVDSSQARVGDTFKASLDQPLMANGNTVIPAGADVITILTDSQQSGKFAGKTELTLDIQSISANGRTYPVQTTGLAQASNSRGSRTAKVVGGTAALGAIIGAIAGGGKGAAIGASAGAATGAGVEAVTAGQRVQIPSETRLTFTLKNGLQI